MSLDTIFQTASGVALVGWLALLASPFLPRFADLMAGWLIPGLLAALYVALVLAFWGRADGGFGSLDEVSALFQSRPVLLAGWVHYLAFDLVVGAWIARRGRSDGLPFWMVLPCLPLTFLFGPAGFLLYLGLRSVFRALRAPAAG